MFIKKHVYTPPLCVLMSCISYTSYPFSVHTYQICGPYAQFEKCEHSASMAEKTTLP